MAISKSQIISKLKSNRMTCYQLDNKTLYIPSSDLVSTLSRTFGLFMIDGARHDKRSPYSVMGAIKVGGFSIVATFEKYAPSKVGTLGSYPNESVKNRLTFGSLIQNVLMSTIKPITVVLDAGKKITVPNVTNAKFSGEGIADFNLMQGNKKFPIAVYKPDGIYRTNITDKNLGIAEEILEAAAIAGNLDASMDGDRMTLNSPVATEASISATRELLFNDIRGGAGVVGDFKPLDFKYDGKSNTLTIKCHRVFAVSSDLKSDDKPFLVVTNSRNGSIGELDGIQLELTPKRNLPRKTTVVDL